ncbi:HTH-type transcriptional activator AmpR [compost metagenome]
MHSWDWDDLRLILAVAEHKSFSGAAQELRVNHTTVLRRINAFEQQHDLRLFNRLASGYTMTEAGEELIRTAEIMKGAVNELALKLEGKDLKLEGTLRITTCDTLMASILPGMISAFRELHPQISLEISTGNFVSDLAQRHADIAIRTGDNPPESLIGRRLADVKFSLYGATGFSQQNSVTDPIAFDRWISPDKTFSAMAISKWVSEKISPSAIVFTANSLVSLKQAALAGVGIAPLPCYLGDFSDGLERIAHSDLDNFSTGLWVLTHQDLRHTARVRAFISFISEQVRHLSL